jgi:hypothetical protein
LPRRLSIVSGCEFSQVEIPWNSGAAIAGRRLLAADQRRAELQGDEKAGEQKRDEGEKLAHGHSPV